MIRRHYVQYHNPDVMGCGIEECLRPMKPAKGNKRGKTSQRPQSSATVRFGLLTNKYFGVKDPRGGIAWVVGQTSEPDSPVCLGWWLVIEDIEPSIVPGFQYELVGSVGGEFWPVLPISDRPWFRILQGLTGNFEFGFTEIKNRRVIKGLREAADQAGCPVPE